MREARKVERESEAALRDLEEHSNLIEGPKSLLKENVEIKQAQKMDQEAFE